jgi:hypothetical protein
LQGTSLSAVKTSAAAARALTASAVSFGRVETALSRSVAAAAVTADADRASLVKAVLAVLAVVISDVVMVVCVCVVVAERDQTNPSRFGFQDKSRVKTQIILSRYYQRLTLDETPRIFYY